jgi:hypothetical protein
MEMCVVRRRRSAVTHRPAGRSARPGPPDDPAHGQEGQHPVSLLGLSSMLAQGRRSEGRNDARVSAPDIEAVVVDALRAAYPDDAALEARALIEAQVGRVSLRAGSIVMQSDARPNKGNQDRMVPATSARQTRDPGQRGQRRSLPRHQADSRTVLLRSIALGRRWLDELPARMGEGACARPSRWSSQERPAQDR